MAKRYSKEDYAVYIAARIASFIICIFPLSVAFWVGRIIGLCMYHFHPKRKRIAYANLKAAFCRDKRPSELKDILRRTYKNYGQVVVEMLRIPKIDHEYLKKYIKIEGMKMISEAEARNKGIIFLTSHFDNWELSSLKSAEIGLPMYVLARPQRFDMLDSLLDTYREKLGCKVIKRKGVSARSIIKALKENKVVGMLADQDVKKEGVFIDLLGRPASHPVGAARLARDTGAAMLPAFIIRQKGPNHLIKVERFITVSREGDRNTEIKKGLEIYTRILESYVKQYPDQWMWVYTRWKSTPLRRVVILNDGKRGHLNQSLAALNVIKRCRLSAGFKDEDTSFEIIDVKFKSRLRRSILTICSLFASHACQGCMKCLKFALCEDSYNRLMHTNADIVISCGSSLSAANSLLSKENNSKNVVIMKPGIVGLRNFDVAIIPKHDGIKEKRNIVITEGSPNLVDERSMKEAGKSIRNIATLEEKKRLGLLIGGDNPEYTITAELATELLGQIEDLLGELDMELLVTTSRRTPKSVEELLKKRFEFNPHCKLLVIANEKNIENAVSGILDLSEIVLVSGESISMVSEAASSGKQTIVFDLEKKRGSSKHEYAIKSLSELNYIVRTPVDKIRDTISELSQNKKPVKKLNNNEKMYEKLYRII